MTVYNSSASASFATIDVKSLGVTTSHATKKNILSVFGFLYQTQISCLYYSKIVKRQSVEQRRLFSQGGEVISVAAWVIDGGIFHIQDCKAANSFLMVSNDGAAFRATEFVVVNSSAAGMLVSSGEVTMRASVKQRCFGSILGIVVLTRRLPFLYVCPCWAMSSCH